MLYKKPATKTMEEMLDKFQIKELLEFERFCRDNSLWDEMNKCFAHDSRVTISWYQGSGYGFVEASRKMKNAAPHKVNNILVWLNGNRAVAVMMASILMRKKIHQKAVDLTAYVRLVYQLVKQDDEWKIISLEGIYEKDSLAAVTPPELESDGFIFTRQSYANLALLLNKDGYSIADNLPGDDLPETVESMLAEKSGWLQNAE